MFVVDQSGRQAWRAGERKKSSKNAPLAVSIHYAVVDVVKVKGGQS
mgnify:FL=1